jgi:glycerate 2-kinase
MDKRKEATEIFLAGVESVKPDNLIRRYVSVINNNLKIDKLDFDLSTISNIYVVGAGKASAAMAQTIEHILGSRITEGHIITKYEHSVPLKFIGTTEAGHPVPDDNGIKGTGKILSIVKKAEKDDLVICLISGGGSALLADVPEGCTLDDLKKVSSILLKTGANITEMNCIRKHLSAVKGGQLSRAAAPARVVSLILSDVIGDPLDVIASGPTAPDPSTFADALSIISKYNIGNEIPEHILQILKDGLVNKRQETLKKSDKILTLTTNLIIGTNKLALSTAQQKAESLGYDSHIITNNLDSDVSEVASYITELAKHVCNQKTSNKTCLLFAGEPTVKVKGNGLGGRNQHLALMSAVLLKDIPDITFLSGGTDGSDGPTDATGAVVDSLTLQKAFDLGLNPEQFIENSDSYSFFKQAGGLIITGPTQTNVMDLMIALID